MSILDTERERLLIQAKLDGEKTPTERNRFGQFATPFALAREIAQFGVSLLEKDCSIRFFDPAFGTGVFFSALLHVVSEDRIEVAKGFEVDPHYGLPARRLWKDTALDLVLADSTRAMSLGEDENRFNLLICNPPYVRHHYIATGEKGRLQDATEAACGVRIAGLAGLYCYFLGLFHAWLQRGGVAGWLIPSEFMDVNYGKAVKRYLTDKVTLLRIHRFDPTDVQFDDALVSSSVVWLRNLPPPADYEVEFTFGGSLAAPRLIRRISVETLKKEAKWTRFLTMDARQTRGRYQLSDFFTIKRGIATGDNKFFILAKEAIRAYDLPFEVFRPILPSPRYVTIDEINSDQDGLPILDHQRFILDCRMSEDDVQARFPKLWEYLKLGKGTVSERYLCRSRRVWYFQETRPPAPILCTYIGRSDSKRGRPFRFILNHSQATAANVYLLLYPKPMLARAIARDSALLRRLWQALNNFAPDKILSEGRVYGGGLHKLEPNELGNVDATPLIDIAPELRAFLKPIQTSLFEQAMA